MNDDTVPDIGGTIGSGGAKVPPRNWRTCIAKAFAMAALCANAKVETVNGIEWEYRIDSDAQTALISSGSDSAIPKDTAGDIEVPEVLGGCRVVEIGDYAFRSCASIVSVVIPEGVETIGEFAFIDCASLSSVKIPQSVARVKKNAFAGCAKQLYDYDTVENAMTVDGWVMRFAPNTDGDLVELRIEGARGIADEAFSGDRDIGGVTFAGDIKTIGCKSFQRCSRLENVIFEGTVGAIGEMAFKNCGKLKDVKFPSGLKEIGDSAFENCYSVTNMTFTHSILRIGEKAFYDCDSMAEFILPSRLEKIGCGAFSSCDSLARIRLSSGGSRFEVRNGVLYTANCRNLIACPALAESVDIPSGTTNIMDEAFDNCTKIKTLDLTGNLKRIGFSAFSECTALTNVVFSKRLKFVDYMAFAWCSSLVEIKVLGEKTEFAPSAFHSCTSLKKVQLVDAYAGSHDAFPEDAEIVRYSLTATVSEEAPAGTEPAYRTQLENAADARLLENITSDAQYASFLEWTGRLTGATFETVKASPFAWLSYALDSSSLITAAPAADGVRIAGFVPSGGANTFDMSVCVPGVSVGGAATAENLAKVFAVEGAASLSDGLFAATNANVSFGVPSDGMARLAVSPKDPSAKSFFFRVRLK